jgi:hypothetical protein
VFIFEPRNWDRSGVRLWLSDSRRTVVIQAEFLVSEGRISTLQRKAIGIGSKSLVFFV